MERSYTLVMPLPPEYEWQCRLGAAILVRQGVAVAQIARITYGWEALLLNPMYLIGLWKDKGKAKVAIERRFK